MTVSEYYLSSVVLPFYVCKASYYLRQRIQHKWDDEVGHSVMPQKIFESTFYVCLINRFLFRWVSVFLWPYATSRCWPMLYTFTNEIWGYTYGIITDVYKLVRWTTYLRFQISVQVRAFLLSFFFFLKITEERFLWVEAGSNLWKKTCWL